MCTVSNDGTILKENSWWNVDQVFLASSQAEGIYLSIEERPLWGIILDKFGDYAFGGLNWLSDRIPGWVRWGRADEDGFSEHSLSYVFFRWAQWSAAGFGTWRIHREVAKVPVTEEWVVKYYPDSSFVFGEDASVVTFGDRAEPLSGNQTSRTRNPRQSQRETESMSDTGIKGDDFWIVRFGSTPSGPMDIHLTKRLYMTPDGFGHTPDIYPVTIVHARYNGTYEGGLGSASWLCFPVAPHVLSSDEWNGWNDSDVECAEWWSRARDGQWPVGRGLTPQYAYFDLCQQVAVAAGVDLGSLFEDPSWPEPDNPGPETPDMQPEGGLPYHA